MTKGKKSKQVYKSDFSVLDVCPHCKGFVDIHVDMKTPEAWLKDAYKRKMKSK